MHAPWRQAQQEAVRDFPQAAENFCELIDRHGEYDRGELFGSLAIQLAHDCAVAAQLPIIEPDTEGEDRSAEQVASQSEKQLKLAASLRKKIGDMDTYWAVFDPTSKKEPDPAFCRVTWLRSILI